MGAQDNHNQSSHVRGLTMWNHSQAGRSHARLAAALTFTLLLGACAHIKSPVVELAPPPAAHVFVAMPGLAPAERVEEAIQRLRQGHREQARVELQAALLAEPNNQRARRLLSAIEADPKVLLGEKHYLYKVRPGETLWSLSQRLLGDPLLFYALARYNGIETPENMEGGRTLMIPGTPRKTVAAPTRRPAAPKTAAAPTAVPANPAQASRLRRSALEHMSRGQIDRAEALLQQARTLDPANTVIQGDLDRARRIQASVRRRS